MGPTIKGETAKELIKKHPNKPSLQLARILFDRYPDIYNSIEDARTTLRYYRGAKGEKHRSRAKELARPLQKPDNPYKLPESYEVKREPYILPTANNNILVLSDLHIPYHSPDAITAALDYGKAHKVNTIFINGDIIDFHGLSRFQKDPRKRSVKEELQATNELLDVLQKTFDAKIYLLLGNHDMRLEHYLMSKAPELFDLDSISLAFLLKAEQRGMIVIDDKTIVRAGKLNITHGHLLLRGVFSPVNTARGIFTKAKVSTLVGHAHKESSHTETDLNGDIVTTWSTGCLCELSPDYNPYANNYCHGFAHVTVNPDKSYQVRNIRIYKGKIL